MGDIEEKNAAGKGTRELPKLTTNELREVERLQQRDREVKAHEQAHKANAGLYARGGANFEYQMGPDGKRYAVGGEVSIDTSKESDPAKTLHKAQVIRRAALAPAEPSAQDRQIAMQAAMMAAQARQELAVEKAQASDRATEASSTDARQSGSTSTGRRALESIDGVMSSAAEPGEQQLDHYV